MKVYILFDVQHYDGSEVLGVLDSLEKAQTEALDYAKRAPGEKVHKDKRKLRWEAFNESGKRTWVHNTGQFSSLMIEECEVR